MTKQCELVSAIRPMSGNNVSHSNRKTKRIFLPNLKLVTLHSDLLGIDVRLRIATKTLRTINKYGGLDNFLLGFGYNKLSEKGRKIRTQLLKKQKELAKK